MNEALALFGALVLTLLGVVVPLVAVLLSIAPDGVAGLVSRYEAERRQLEEQINGEMAKKRADGAAVDLDALGRTLKELRLRESTTARRLRFLQPRYALWRCTLPLAAALAIVALSLAFKFSGWLLGVSFGAGVFFFSRGVKYILDALDILSDLYGFVAKAKQVESAKLIELLSRVAENTGDDKLFVAPERIGVKFNKTEVKDGSRFPFSVDKDHLIELTLVNSAPVMCEQLELGVIFPKDALVERESGYQLFVGDENQIVRFEHGAVHGNTSFIFHPKIKVKFLKAGDYTAYAFVKGKNVKTKNFPFTWNIVA